MSRNNRRAGNNYERLIRKEYESLGFEKAVTSRQESRSKDAGKVDIIGIEPFEAQCKWTRNYPDLFSLLDSMVVNKGNIPVVHHKRNKGSGPTEEIVVIKKEDWYEIVQMLKKESII